MDHLSGRPSWLPVLRITFFGLRFSDYRSVGEALASPTSLSGSRRRPTLPGRCQPSTISAKRLNFCVRYGNRWIPLAIITGNLSVCPPRLFALPFRLSTSGSLFQPRLFSHTFTTAQHRVSQYEFLLFASFRFRAFRSASSASLQLFRSRFLFSQIKPSTY